MLQLYGCHYMWYVLVLYVVTQYPGMEEWICQMPEFTQTNKMIKHWACILYNINCTFSTW